MLKKFWQRNGRTAQSTMPDSEKEQLLMENAALKQEYNECFKNLRYAEGNITQLQKDLDEQRKLVERAKSIISGLCKMAMVELDDKTIYELVAPLLDEDGRYLFAAACTITGHSVSDIENFYTYECARGYFEVMEPRGLMPYLEGMVFGKQETETVGCYERTVKSEILETEDWHKYQRQLYSLAITKIGITS